MPRLAEYQTIRIQCKQLFINKMTTANMQSLHFQKVVVFYPTSFWQNFKNVQKRSLNFCCTIFSGAWACEVDFDFTSYIRTFVLPVKSISAGRVLKFMRVFDLFDTNPSNKSRRMSTPTKCWFASFTIGTFPNTCSVQFQLPQDIDFITQFERR